MKTLAIGRFLPTAVRITICNADIGCEISVSGTYGSKSFSFLLEVLDTGAKDVEIFDSKISSPEIEVAETGLGQGDIADWGDAGARNSDSRLCHDINLHRGPNSGDADLTLARAAYNSASNVTVDISAPGSTTVSAERRARPSPSSTRRPWWERSRSISALTTPTGDEAPYNFTISGSATGAPEISVAETGQGQGDIARWGDAGPGNSDARHRHDIDLYRDQPRVPPIWRSSLRRTTPRAMLP